MIKVNKVVSLFSGCGGLDLGFINSGFDVIWANDFYLDAVNTYKLNIGEHIIHGDITKIQSRDIPNDFDVLLGGFPCQGFSVANTKRSMSDERNFLYKEMLRIIRDKQPKFFVAENVKGLLSIQKGEVIKMIVNDFKSIGYNVEYKILRASNYGVPQHRERVFIIGNRCGINNTFPEHTHGDKNLHPFINVKDVIGHLSDIDITYNPINFSGNIIKNHIARTNVQDTFWARKHPLNQEEICDYLKIWRQRAKISTSKIDEIFGYSHTAGHWFRKDNNSGSIPNPSDWLKLKEILRFDDRYDKQVIELEIKPISFEQSLRVSNWDTPSDTITATGPEIHPNKMRRLSVRECAIIQTFPNNFEFTGSLASMYTQIGNAVPVKLAENVANVIKHLLNNGSYRN